MGSVTILNGTNTLINSSISAGVNYSWANKISPKKYYIHNGGPGSIVTLNSKYWLGEGSEYDFDIAGTLVAVLGVVVGVAGVAVGVVGVLLSGGFGAPVLVAVGALALAELGAGIGGITFAVADFVKTPVKLTGIQTIQDCKFIAEGTVTLSKGADGTVTISDASTIKLRELQDSEFQRLINEGGYTQHEYKPVVGSYATVATLKAAGLHDKLLSITPVLNRDSHAPRWEIEGDALGGGNHPPVQLWTRDTTARIVPQTMWKLVPRNLIDEYASEFAIYNPELKRYVTCGTKIGDRVTTASELGHPTYFKVLRTESEKHGAGFVLSPVGAANAVVICENGNLGNSTKLVLGQAVGPNPGWALWRFTTL